MTDFGVGPVGGGDALARLKSGRIKGEEARLRAATELLEGVFYQQMFMAMRSTVPEGGMMSGGQGEEMFTGLLDERMAEAAALRSDGGLGSALYRHLAGAAGLDAGGGMVAEGGEDGPTSPETPPAVSDPSAAHRG